MFRKDGPPDGFRDRFNRDDNREGRRDFGKPREERGSGERRDENRSSGGGYERREGGGGFGGNRGGGGGGYERRERSGGGFGGENRERSGGFGGENRGGGGGFERRERTGFGDNRGGTGGYDREPREPREHDESVFSKRLRAGKRRTYFFDVKRTKGEDYFITLTESTKKMNGFGYDRHKMFLYKEDFNRFVESLQEVVNHVKTDLMPNYDYDEFARRQEEWEAQNRENDENGENGDDDDQENPTSELSATTEIAEEEEAEVSSPKAIIRKIKAEAKAKAPAAEPETPKIAAEDEDDVAW
jgi:Protein of unknown function (DUF3276)